MLIRGFPSPIKCLPAHGYKQMTGRQNMGDLSESFYNILGKHDGSMSQVVSYPWKYTTWADWLGF